MCPGDHLVQAPLHTGLKHWTSDSQKLPSVDLSHSHGRVTWREHRESAPDHTLGSKGCMGSKNTCQGRAGPLSSPRHPSHACQPPTGTFSSLLPGPETSGPHIQVRAGRSILLPHCKGEGGRDWAWLQGPGTKSQGLIKTRRNGAGQRVLGPPN